MVVGCCVGLFVGRRVGTFVGCIVVGGVGLYVKPDKVGVNVGLRVGFPVNKLNVTVGKFPEVMSEGRLGMASTEASEVRISSGATGSVERLVNVTVTVSLGLSDGAWV